MVICSLPAHLTDCMSTITTPILRMVLMADTMAEVSYMPPKAVRPVSVPSRQGQKPAAVMASISRVAVQGRPFWLRAGMNVS